jgi:hypothetical protein
VVSGELSSLIEFPSLPLSLFILFPLSSPIYPFPSFISPNLTGSLRSDCDHYGHGHVM